METLLLEIGTEEIPAGYISPALDALAGHLAARLDDLRIAHGGVRTLGTPKRLAVLVEAVAPRQTTVTVELTGPPRRAAFDAQGQPTLAAVRFAEKAGVPLSRLKVRQTDKGEYLTAVKKEKGQATRTLLAAALPEIVLAIPFPKSMRWADLSIQFARPIQWLVALLGSKVIPFQLGGLKSGRRTRGHAFMRPGPVALDRPEDYVENLRQAQVLVDPEERRARIAAEVAAAARQAGGEVLPDEDLLDTVTHLVEFPVVATGRFGAKFLELPDEILITSMREHQKYFAVLDPQGKLRPHFVVVNNTRARDMALVSKGHERVLRARLEDAIFFFRNDRQTAMDDWCAKLAGVLFQARLGSVLDKVGRVRRLAGHLAEALDLPAAERQRLDRAAQLCKADLVSQVVVEFPKLQGIMGRVYATHAGEAPEVAAAIEDHYRPTHSGGTLPGTVLGALLSIADKIDTLCGCFSVGLLPTGASDPYALRRQAIGIVQILLDRGLGLSLGRLVEAGLAPFDDPRREETAARVMGFLQDRMAHLLAEEGHPKDLIAAVTSVSVDHVPHVWEKVAALEDLKAAPDFEPLAVAFKRAVNILRKARKDGLLTAQAAVDAGLFTHPAEAGLHRACQGVRESVAGHLAGGRFQEALRVLATLREPVDGFFDGVMVMDEDPRVRGNRLALLGQIAGLFESIADFSRLAT
jgi:glycyl-tRNA synthetase beta chain